MIPATVPPSPDGEERFVSEATSTRLRKPSWRDPRLLLGLLLVLLSTAGTVALVAGLDRGVEVYVARTGIPVGQQLAADDFDRVTVRLGNAEALYVRADEPLPDETIATAFVGKGQLIPRTSIGAARSLTSKPVAVAVEGVLPEQLQEGAAADLWTAAPDERNGFKEPRLLVRAGEVVKVVQSQQAFGSNASQVVIVLIPDAQLPQVLAAQANKSRISLVWNPAGRAS